jgi:hypothetical protein
MRSPQLVLTGSSSASNSSSDHAWQSHRQVSEQARPCRHDVLLGTRDTVDEDL